MAEFRSGFVCLVGYHHRQVDVDQHNGRLSCDHVDPPADHPAHHPCIVHRQNFQIVLVDTPGLHRPRHAAGPAAQRSGQRHLFRGRREGLCSPADGGDRPGDRWIHSCIRTVALNTTLVAIVTKIDKVSKERVAAQPVAVSELEVGRTPRSCQYRPPP